MERRLKPVRDNLSRLKKATPKNYPVKDALVKILKVELIAIGNFIRAATRDEEDAEKLEERLWVHTVKHYWPRPDVTVSVVRHMYQKMLQTELNGKQASNAKPTNGETSGKSTNGQKSGE